LGLLLLGACSSPYTYVKNSESNTFFRVPRDWKLYDGRGLLPASNPIVSSPQAPTERWQVVFDANPRPTRKFFGSPRFPQGFAIIRPLTNEERDVISLASLRNLVFPIDQLLTQDPKSVDILKSEDLVVRDGFRGSRIIFTINRGADFLAVNQTGLIDMDTKKLYVFLVGCGVDCYIQNRETIDQIVGSWTVTEPLT
jgi:hypothetical protein